MTDDAIARRLIEALAREGFAAETGVGRLSFRGAVIVRGKHIPLRLSYSDLEFASSPRIYVEDCKDIPRLVAAHLDDKNELCAVDRTRFVSDRYLVVEQALGLLVRARNVLDANWTNAAEQEIAAEFPQHWGQATVKLAVNAGIKSARVTTDANGLLRIVSAQSADAGAPACGIVSTATRLSFAAHQKRPETLGEVLDWAGYWEASLPEKITDALGSLEPRDPLCCIFALNGTIAFQIELATRSPKLVSVLSEHGAWRRYLSTDQAGRLAIRRLATKRVDMEYVIGRGNGGTAPLRNKSVVLVGCGAIGGYLSHSLARLGAGFGDGRLTLVDHDRLSEENIGRHLLGIELVDVNKSAGCKKRVDLELPGLNVSARPTRIEPERSSVIDADLVIDATGEQAVGDLLNAWMIDQAISGERSPALLHAWLEGHGAAAVTYMSTDREFGCFRCLQPINDEPARYRMLRPEAPRELSGGCGENVFAPYGPAAPMMAAALAAQHASDWASGGQRPLLRVARLDLRNTYDIKPANPSRSARCPACSRLFAPV